MELTSFHRHHETFIRATEVWALSQDGAYLELASADYGPMTSLREVSEAMTFTYDEGLPGKAWAYGHPIILKQLQGSYFKRADVAREWGLTCATALPIFAGEFLKAVVVLRMSMGSTLGSNLFSEA